MHFRIALVGHRHLEPAARAALLAAVSADTQLPVEVLAERLDAPEPWLADVETPELAERHLSRWEAAHNVSLTVYPLRTQSPAQAGPAPEAAPLDASPDAAPAADAAPGESVPATATTVPPTSIAQAAVAPHAPPAARPPAGVILKPGRVLDMRRLEAPPPRTSRLFLLLVVVGVFGIWYTARDWYMERSVGGLLGQSGTPCDVGPGWYEVGSGESTTRIKRAGPDGRCVGDTQQNGLGCGPVRLLNGGSTLHLGTDGVMDFTLSVPGVAEWGLEPGTYEVQGKGEDHPNAFSDRPRCEAWTGKVTVNSLQWVEHPRAERHDHLEVKDASVEWDLICGSGGAQTQFKGCFVQTPQGRP